MSKDHWQETMPSAESTTRAAASYGNRRLPTEGGGHGMSRPEISHETLSKPDGMNAEPDTSFLGGPGTEYLKRMGVTAAHVKQGHNRGPGHPGFKAVAAKIGKNPKIRNPGAVLAAATRNASPAAKRKNPRLKRVKG